MKNTQKTIQYLALVLAALGVSLTLFYPMGVLFRTVWISPSDFFQALADPEIAQVAWVTVRQAAWSVFFAVLLGLPLGLWLSGSRRAERWLVLPAGVPTLVSAAAWVMILRNTAWSYSFSAVVLAHAFFNAPWIALGVSQARRWVDPALVEAAETLGANPFFRFRKIDWPVLRTAFFSACLQAWIWCSMSFALVKILGGGPPVDTLETLLFSKIIYSGLDWSGTLACAVWQTALTLVPWFFLQKLEARGVHMLKQSRAEKKRSRLQSVIQEGVSLIFLLPYVLVWVVGIRASLQWSAETWIEIMHAMVQSFRVAGMTLFLTLSAALVLTLSGRKIFLARILNAVVQMTSGFSTLVLALLLWWSLGPGLLSWGFVQMWIFLPFAMRVSHGTRLGVQTHLLEAAESLGASAWKSFWVIEWPRWRAPVASVAAAVMAGSLGEVAAASLFSLNGQSPMPVLISQWMSRYRFAEAESAAGVLLLFSLMSGWAVHYFGTRKEMSRSV